MVGKKRTSINTDLQTMDEIEDLIKKFPELKYKSKAQFAKKAIEEKITKIRDAQLLERMKKFDITKNYYEVEKLKKDVDTLKDEKKEWSDVAISMAEETEKSAEYGKKIIKKLGFEKQLNELVEKKLKAINWKPYKK